METDTKKTEMTLEETFARLDAITAALEDPSTGLEASFALYKEGSELLKQAGGKIDLVQKQVQDPDRVVEYLDLNGSLQCQDTEDQ